MFDSTRSGARARPMLETLEGRDVPTAGIQIDLTSDGAVGEVNEAHFQQVDAQPTGTGVISSFLRLQNTGVERGYNTDFRGLQFNENSSPRFTRSLRLNDVPIVLVDGIAYRQFLLDINQRANLPLLSLDELKIFLGGQGNLNGYNETTGQLAGLDAIYNLDAGGDNSVLLNYNLNHGSGSGDMVVLIPDRLFASSHDNPYVYLYSSFGVTAGGNAGFEEWAVLPKTDISNLGSLAGSVYFDADNNGVRNDGEQGIGGVYITLSGIDDRGNEVHLTTITDSSGNYSFVLLRPGLYNLTESQPEGYVDGAESLGSLGGEVGEDLFSNIELFANQFGVGYDFGEIDEIPNS